MPLPSDEQLRLLMDRVKYINDIRINMFKFHLVAAGVLSGFVLQKLDLSIPDPVSKVGMLVIGSVSLGVFLVGVSLFVFDLWALARLRATTAGIHKRLPPQERPRDADWSPWLAARG